MYLWILNGIALGQTLRAWVGGAHIPAKILGDQFIVGSFNCS